MLPISTSFSRLIIQSNLEDKNSIQQSHFKTPSLYLLFNFVFNMRYSIVLASLAASAYATSFINVEVGNELSEASEGLRRGNDNNGHGKDGHCEDRNRGDRSRDVRDREDRKRGGRSQDGSRNGHRSGDRSREDRRRGGREEDREHGGWFSFLKTHSGRHGSYEDRYGRGGRQGQ